MTEYARKQEISVQPLNSQGETIPDSSSIILAEPHLLRVGNGFPVIRWEQTDQLVAVWDEAAQKTFYQHAMDQYVLNEAGQPYSGPLNLIAVNLVITTGATVQDLVFIGSPATADTEEEKTVVASVRIEAGGSLENSLFFTGLLELQEKGRSVNNEYYAMQFLEQKLDGCSVNDQFFRADLFSLHYEFGAVTGEIEGKKGSDKVETGKHGRLLNPLFFGVKWKNPSQAKKHFIRQGLFAGSLVETNQGKIAVEALKVGDYVQIYDDRGDNIGVQQILAIHQQVYDSAMVYQEVDCPIHIVKDALAKGMPDQDMRVTADYCLSYQGQPVPLRLLVNGCSLYHELPVSSLTCYSLELGTPQRIQVNNVILSGLSVIDFPRIDYVQHKESLFHKLFSYYQTRAFAMQIPFPEKMVGSEGTRQISPEKEITGKQMVAKPIIEKRMVSDLGLHLVTDTGTLLPVLSGHGNRYSFLIPDGIRQVRIRSHASRPCDAIGAFAEDQRQLGVRVGDVTLFSNQNLSHLSIHDQKMLPGWYKHEATEGRWTNGNALLFLAEEFAKDKSILVLEILQGGPYFLAG